MGSEMAGNNMMMGSQIRPGAMGALSQMTMNVGAQSGQDPKQVQSLQKDLQQISSIPGGQEMLFTMAAEEMMRNQGVSTQGKKLRLFDNGMGPRDEEDEGYARGGLAQVAERTRQAGRGNDDVLLHMSPEEFQAIEAMWGPADINPRTGIPEYGFLSKAWKSVKKAVKKVVKNPVFQVVAPIALNMFVPGAGAAIGSYLGASGMAATALGGAVIQGGLAAAAGARGKDFWRAAALGGAGGALSHGMQYGFDAAGRSAGATPNFMGTGEGIAEAAKSAPVVSPDGSFVSAPPAPAPAQIASAGTAPVPANAIAAPSDIGALGTDPSYLSNADYFASVDPQAINAPTQVAPAPYTGGVAPQAMGVNPAAAAAKDPTLMQKVGKYAGYGLGALTLANAVAPPSVPEEPSAQDAQFENDPRFFASLPQQAYTREQQPWSADTDWYSYGRTGSYTPGQGFYTEGQFVDLVQDPVTGEYITPDELDRRKSESASVMAARGGSIGYAEGGSRHYKGMGSGRDDKIDALLSDGEYVMDAETVSLLGDGSNDEGARRLDQMCMNLRKHKAKNMAKGGFSSNAKNPLSYLKTARG